MISRYSNGDSGDPSQQGSVTLTLDRKKVCSLLSLRMNDCIFLKSSVSTNLITTCYHTSSSDQYAHIPSLYLYFPLLRDA